MRTVVIGGTSGLGLEIARHRAGTGDEVVLTGRDPTRVKEVAASVGESARGIPLELAEPHAIGAALADVGPVDRLVLAAIDRDANSIADYDIDRATRLATIKLIGYAEVIHALRPGMGEDASVVVFGGRAKDRPYPGSLTVSTVNGAVTGMVNALALELAPIRVNAIHPGIVGRQPVLGRQARGGARGLPQPHAHRPPGHHGRHRRRRGLPAGERGRSTRSTSTSTAGGWSRDRANRAAARRRDRHGPDGLGHGRPALGRRPPRDGVEPHTRAGRSGGRSGTRPPWPRRRGRPCTGRPSWSSRWPTTPPCGPPTAAPTAWWPGWRPGRWWPTPAPSTPTRCAGWRQGSPPPAPPCSTPRSPAACPRSRPEPCW